MTFSYAVRKLSSLPWPSSLGKDIEFPGLHRIFHTSAAGRRTRVR